VYHPPEIEFSDYFKSHEYAEIANIANCVVRLDEFRDKVISFKNYTFTSLSGDQIYEILRTKKTTIIRPIWPRNIFTKMIGTTFSGDESIYFNARSTRKNPSWVNTAIHERLHILGLSHGDNNPRGKENAPHFKIGSFAEELAHKCQ
jgi:hypothetical protein